jgi:hypothetical protein
MTHCTSFAAIRMKCALLAGFLFTPQVTSAQGTIQFGFEDFQVKDRPPFVTGDSTIEDNSNPFLQGHPFEGQKFLLTGTGATIQSPDGNPIISYTMHVYPPRHQLASDSWLIFIGDKPWSVGIGGSWQTFQATLDSPVDSLLIRSFWSFETVSSPIGIDAIEFVTIPEPQTLWLLTIGLAAIASRPLLKHRKQNRA